MATINIDDRLYETLEVLAQQRGQAVESVLAAIVSAEAEQDPAFNPGFTRILSHDLRTPLATIMSSSDLIKHYHDRLSAERMNEHLDTIQTHVQILDGQFDNLTILYKARTQVLSFEPQAQDLDHLCRMVIQRVNGYLHVPREIRYEMVGSEHEARCDLSLMRVALANILGNAVKFSAEQTPVHMTLKVDEQGAEIQVRDQGMGIPADEVERVFELFFRASNAASMRGEGIGLAVARKIVALHNGGLRVESEAGAGTVVTIWLPDLPQRLDMI